MKTTVLTFFKAVYAEWSKDEALNLGAALAYYTVISLPALLLSIVLALSLFIDRTAVATQLTTLLEPSLGTAPTQTVLSLLQQQDERGETIPHFIIGIIFTFFGATGIFIQLQASLNKIWNVPSARHAKITEFLLNRGRALAAIIVIAIFGSILSAGNAALLASSTSVSNHLNIPHAVFFCLQFLFNLILVTSLFTGMFKFLPDVKIATSDALKGAAITAALFLLGELIIGIYLSKSSLGSSFGIGGSIIGILVWIYYSAQIIFLGAEITQVYANKYGQGIKFK